ncbi:MAG: DUF4198 domain-containing protein [Thalassovita sp.]
MKIRIIPLLLTLLATQAVAHEVWIEPQNYQVEKGAQIAASLKNGEGFAGIELGWFSGQIALFDVIARGTRRAIAGRPGDLPAIQGLKTRPGLVVLVHQSKPKTVTYETWEKFQKFIDHKDFGDVRRAHVARGLPEKPLREVYTRFAKSLLAVGHGKGADAETGLETEIIALANPYRGSRTEMPVRVLYKGAPRVDAQIELFDRGPDGSVTITYHRTNAVGEAVLPIQPGHEYLVDAVVLREPSPELATHYTAQWETLWASLTFAVPE